MKITSIVRHSILILTASSILACSKDASTSNNPSTPTNQVAKNIYVAGVDIVGQTMIPVYWKNGVKIQLSNTFSYVNDIYVSGSDVHVVGYEGLSNPLPVYWKNGVKTQLSTRSGQANAVFVSGSDVYICGTEQITSTTSAGFIWKNGTKTQLQNCYGATGLYVKGFDVYVAGYSGYNGFTTATLWKSGVPTIFTTSPLSTGTAHSVYVTDSKLYLLGMTNKVLNKATPVLWQSSLPISSSSFSQSVVSTNNQSYPTSVAVAGSNVYISGDEGGACYWKNGVRTQLSTNPESTADKVITFGNDFYIAGRGGNDIKAGYWKNGIRVDLPSNSGSYATSIFVD